MGSDYIFLEDLLNRFHTSHPNIQALMVIMLGLVLISPLILAIFWMKYRVGEHHKCKGKFPLEDAYYHSVKLLDCLNKFKQQPGLGSNGLDCAVKLEIINSEIQNRICKIHDELRDGDEMGEKESQHNIWKL